MRLEMCTENIGINVEMYTKTIEIHFTENIKLSEILFNFSCNVQSVKDKRLKMPQYRQKLTIGM